MRSRFDKELILLNQELMEMGALVEMAIKDAAKALLNRDADLARDAAGRDAQIDDKEKEIERRCLKLLLQQQPVAADLRIISTALKMITDLERIGDQAQDISELTLRLMNDPSILDLKHVHDMAHATTKMVTGSIDAFVARDKEKALDIIAADDTVDALFICVKNDLIRLIQEDTANGEQAIDLLMIAKYFERIGDHATNIAGWVLFSITGQHGAQRVL